jgi:TM2 domain-containing membrane protein YozV
MNNRHRNKTITTLLAAVMGGAGLHRFYLYGWQDKWAWAHLASLPLSWLAMAFGSGVLLQFSATPFIISTLIGFIEALVLGLTPDLQWDAAHNAQSGRVSASSWPLALILVFTVGVGATGLIAAMARMADLVTTGGAYG